MARGNPDPARRLRAPAGLDDLLLYRLSRLLSTGGSMVIRLCEGRFGITRREWRLVAILATQPGLLSSQLAERAQLDRARTSKAVTSLVAKQLVTRVAESSDRRQARLALTAEGERLHDALFPLVRGINRELVSVLDAGQLRELHTALDRMQQQAEALQARAVLPKADRHRGRTRAPAE